MVKYISPDQNNRQQCTVDSKRTIGPSARSPTIYRHGQLPFGKGSNVF